MWNKGLKCGQQFFYNSPKKMGVKSMLTSMVVGGY